MDTTTLAFIVHALGTFGALCIGWYAVKPRDRKED